MPAFANRKNPYPFLAVLGLVGLLALLAAPGWADKPAGPPETKRVPVTEALHGVEVVDPYRWLEDQQAPETRAWIEAQNEYTESLLGQVPGREELRKRLTELMRIDTLGTPRVRHGRYFFMKRGADQDLSVLYLREGLEGEDQVLVDPHPMSPDHT
ncbi:MAG: hypothetical protein V3R29_09885, partial [Candidatus Acidoferrales bacterium]